MEPLQELGYEHVFHEAFPARRFFRKGKRRAGTRHLHVYIFQSEEWKNQLRFRNYLRKHSVERQAYETLKKTWRGVFHITGLLYKRKRIGSSQP
ncbi:GrpB family protein [Bacillus licheniformis]|nr:GrpB family protein [Bacillus licheniformis]